ncbi:metallophosphoesterase [Candidatus Woesearchaeota archaeon]|nr:metallophosphoesterase [Candidatus Woesearchaeota archaeon]
MKIADGIEIIDLALYLREHGALVIGDVHIGFEESMTRQGVLLPRFQFKDTVERLGRILEKVPKLREIIVNGDLKHEFGRISEQEWRETLKLLDFMKEHCERIVLVKGNHDVILGPIARKRGIEVVKDYCLGETFITHGHEIPKGEGFEKAEAAIIGDAHPAVSIREGARSELFKCFLKGKWEGKLLIAMPSFNLVTIGTDVLKERIKSPFLKEITDFEVFVVGDKVYGFGDVGKLMLE